MGHYLYIYFFKLLRINCLKIIFITSFQNDISTVWKGLDPNPNWNLDPDSDPNWGKLQDPDPQHWGTVPGCVWVAVFGGLLTGFLHFLARAKQGQNYLKVVNFLKKNEITIPSLRYRKAKELTVRLYGFVKTLLLEGIDTLGLLLLLRNRSGINSCYAYSKKFNQRRHFS